MGLKKLKEKLFRKKRKSSYNVNVDTEEFRDDTSDTDLLDEDRLAKIRRKALQAQSNYRITERSKSSISLNKLVHESQKMRTSDDYVYTSTNFELMQSDKSLQYDPKTVKKSSKLDNRKSKVMLGRDRISDTSVKDQLSKQNTNYLIAVPVAKTRGQKATLANALGNFVRTERKDTIETVLDNKSFIEKTESTVSSVRKISDVETILSGSKITIKQAPKSEPILRKRTIDKTSSTTDLPQKKAESKTDWHKVPLKEDKSSDNSLIQIKFRSQLNEGSCTQYFAVSSPLQIEPYLQELKALEKIRQSLPPITKELKALDSAKVVKHQGYMDLSKATLNEYLKGDEIGSASSPNATIPKAGQTSRVFPRSTPRKHKCRTCSEESESYISGSESTIAEREDDLDEKHDDEVFQKIESNYDKLDNELFRLVILNMQPLTPLLNYSFGNFDQDEFQGYKLKWKFLKHYSAVEFRINNPNEQKIYYYQSYSFKITPATYLYLLKCPMAIELYVLSDENETLIGKCNLKISRAFERIHKVYESTMEINNNDLCLCFPQLTPMIFGYLVCRYSLRGDPKSYHSCAPPPIKPIFVPPMKILEHSGGTIPEQTGVTSSIVSDSELQAFQEGLNLVLVRNKALRTTQEEITNELRERTTWMHEELKWRLTLQENAILCGKDPEAVKWRQWKDEATANVKYRSLAHEEYFKNNTAELEIEIAELKLLPESKPMLDENLTHIYMEYTFLTYSGVSMETATMKKPDNDQSICFNFKKSFYINLNEPEAMILAKAIQNNGTVDFVAISQPIEDISELQSCCDFGIAQLKLFDLIQHRTNTVIENIPLHDVYNPAQVLGNLKIKFSGVLSMRSLALRLLTPSNFKIVR